MSEAVASTPTFEDHYAELERILGRLEGGDLSLDASLQEYERGVSALRACRTILTQAEMRIAELGQEPQAD